MTRALFAVLVAACTSSPAEGIPGDHSADDGTRPESAGGTADGAGRPIVAGKGVLIDAPAIVHVYWGSFWSTDDGATQRLVLDALPAALAH